MGPLGRALLLDSDAAVTRSCSSPARARRVDVAGEEGLVVAGVGGEEVTDGGGTGGGVVGSLGAFVEVGVGGPGVQEWVVGRLRRGEGAFGEEEPP